MTAIFEARTAQDSDTPATSVFAAPIRHPSAWTVADFRSPADYSVDLDAAQLRDIAAAMPISPHRSDAVSGEVIGGSSFMIVRSRVSLSGSKLLCPAVVMK